jgi:hypothetical protein
MTDFMKGELGAPKIVDRGKFQAKLDTLLVREKAHTREGDAIGPLADGCRWYRWTPSPH